MNGNKVGKHVIISFVGLWFIVAYSCVAARDAFVELDEGFDMVFFHVFSSVASQVAELQDINQLHALFFPYLQYFEVLTLRSKVYLNADILNLDVLLFRFDSILCEPFLLAGLSHGTLALLFRRAYVKFIGKGP